MIALFASKANAASARDCPDCLLRDEIRAVYPPRPMQIGQTGALRKRALCNQM
ncbi:hypothetical protein LT85_1803 [Collimonas arenae]|uniref:Uncharacterized protein n=1 Tax=Collimonas arenae TaxID=279058 RepID=A0A0A1F8V6_9BURK|nr:hypothetical protein LT85_1803 [Collimonas arenae]